MIRRCLSLAATGLGIILVMTIAAPAAERISASDWGTYVAKFVEDSGRVVDDGNGGISHSESQGYGLLLAYLAGNRGDFERIWSFTRTELLLRDDGLAVWRWDPNATPHVTDQNNATDGDILIAYALGLAGEAWNRPDLTESAARIARAIGEHTILDHGGHSLLMPGVAGYGPQDRPDGPVINLSYWIFEAFPVLARLAPDTDWAKVDRDGRSLIDQASANPANLPPDWLSVARRPKPAEGFPPEFSYNAFRIPLYLMRSDDAGGETLRKIAVAMTGADGDVERVDVTSGAVKEDLPDVGYRIIPAAAACILDGTPVPATLQGFQPTLYYPSTLHLLTLALLTERHPECLG